MTFRITQSDTSPAIVSELTDSGIPVDISGADEIRFIMEDKYKNIIIDDDLSGSVNIVDGENGEVEYIFSEEDTATAGTYKAEWEVTFDGATTGVETFPTGNKITVEIGEEIA
jgi:hypothetical protein